MLFGKTREIHVKHDSDRINVRVSGIEFAWRVHAAQESWASKVDGKASILLALNGGILFAIISANGNGGIFSALSGWRKFVELVAVGLILCALALAASVVFPRLGSRLKHKGQRRENFVYFGHIRHWEALDLHRRLGCIEIDEQLASLSLQLVNMSEINWVKHRLVQFSLTFSFFAILSLSAASVL